MGTCGMAMAILTLLLAGTALAQDPVSTNTGVSKDTQQSKDGVESDTVAESKAEKEFEPPPGYLPKKRGNKVVYCKKDQEIGTRFPSEKCFDEDQLRAYLLAREQANRDFEQRRAICADPTICAP